MLKVIGFETRKSMFMSQSARECKECGISESNILPSMCVCEGSRTGVELVEVGQNEGEGGRVHLEGQPCGQVAVGDEVGQQARLVVRPPYTDRA
jgi:hypothetical protein